MNNNALKKTESFEKPMPSSSGIFSEDNLKEFTSSVSELSDRVKEVSTDVADSSIKFAKKYPIHTAIGTAVAGFVLGAMVQKAKKK